MRTTLLILLATLLGLTLPGCGYTHGTLFRDDIRTVAVGYFENRSFYRDIETDFKEALSKRIEATTPYKLVDRSAADAVLEGAIVRVDQDRLYRTTVGGLPQEVELRVVVDFTWRNPRTGAVLAQRLGYLATGRYIPTRPIGEDLTQARLEAARDLADGALATLRAKW